jgi:hypothetical protein
MCPGGHTLCTRRRDPASALGSALEGLPLLVCALQTRGAMNQPGTQALLSAGLIAGLLSLSAGCGTTSSNGTDGGLGGGDGGGGGGVACGYYIERGPYSPTNVQIVDFGSETTWSTGTPLSRHARNPAGDFAWVPLWQTTVLGLGIDNAGGLGKVSNDGRCSETLNLFDHIEDLTGDPDGFTHIEQQAELSIAPVDFAFPTTLAAAAAAPDHQDVAVRIIADLTRDKTRVLSGGGEARQQIAKQTVSLSATCAPAAQVTRKWAAKADRDDPAFCRPAGADFECVQFNLVWAPDHCTLVTEPVELALPSGHSDIALGGSLTLRAPATYALRIDDVRLFGAAR